MRSPTIHFVAGLPRSGSTLLMNLLAQNPAHHVTPTNGLISMMAILRDNWTGFDAFKAQGLHSIEHRVAASLRGMSYGFFERELAQGKVVFDKSRGWLQHVEMLEAIYQRPVRVLCPVRDIKAIVASFEKLHRQNPLARRQYLGPAYFQAQTIQGRAEVLCSPSGIVGLPISFMRDALNRGVSDRIVLVPYNRLTEDTQGMLSAVHDQLGLAPFEYDPENVEQITREDDDVHGWGPSLHKIRPRVEKQTTPAWEGVLPPHTCAWIDAQFQDLHDIIHPKG